MIDRNNVERLVGTKVNDMSIYQTAFVHKSALSEHITECNERLEFIGDSVLSLVVTRFLFEKYPKAQEGFLTRIRIKLVSGTTLAQFAQILRLDQWMIMDQRAMEQNWNTNPKVLEDVFESLIGAIYMDLGMIHARNFVVNIINNPNIINFQDMLIDTNYKDVVTRHCQAQKWDPPTFVAHPINNGQEKWFHVELFIQGKPCGHGKGKSKRQAEQAASLMGLNIMKIPTQFIN